jgi:gas vesicle protein
MKKQFLFVGALIVGLGMTACSSSVETTEGETTFKDAMDQLKESTDGMKEEMKEGMDKVTEELNEQKDAMEETIKEQVENKVEEVSTEVKEEATMKGKEALKEVGM